MGMLLDSIDQPSDLKQLNEQQVEQLCAEIRQFLLENISKTGGHLASNLGMVELTVARTRTRASTTLLLPDMATRRFRSPSAWRGLKSSAMNPGLLWQ